MNCFVHQRAVAVGVCAACQRTVCPDCAARDAPRLLCRNCVVAQPAILGFEYRSRASIGGWPLVHVCAGVDPTTMRPRVAKGIVAIGNLAVGVVAIAGLACGVITIGGASVGLLFALGGAAVGPGLSIGGFALGSVAVGGAAIGFVYAIGGAAFAPAIADGRRCDQAVIASSTGGSAPASSRRAVAAERRCVAAVSAAASMAGIGARCTSMTNLACAGGWWTKVP